MSSGRASRVPAPGARRVSLAGVMAVPDDFGRLRLIVLGERPDGTPDSAWARLRVAHVDCEPGGAGAGHAGEPHGVVCLVLPAHRRAHWRGVAEALRGQWVTAEATVRPFKRECGGSGNALDLAMLAPLAPAARSPPATLAPPQ